MKYTVNQSSQEEVLAHLQACDAMFSPPLSSRVDLPAYAEKIHAKAECFEAWNTTVLTGLVAAYCNGETRTAFITHVGILPEAKGKGIAKTLCQQVIEHAKMLQLNSVSLEVRQDNLPAIGLYQKLGFSTIATSDPNVTMRLSLPRTTP